MIIWMTDPPASCTTRRLASLNRERPVGEDKSLVRPSCRLDRLNMCVSRVEQGQVATKLRDPGPVRAKNLLGRRDLHGSTTLISNSTTTSTIYPGSRLSLGHSAVRVLTGRFSNWKQPRTATMSMTTTTTTTGHGNGAIRSSTTWLVLAVTILLSCLSTTTSAASSNGLLDAADLQKTANVSLTDIT